MNARNGSHENISHEHAIEGPSDRAFAFSFAVIFLCFAGYSYWRNGNAWTILLGLAVLFGLFGWIAPRVLHPLNIAWLKLGLLLYRVVNPIIMAIMYCCSIVPMGLLLRAMGKDILHLKLDRQSKSYWVQRTPPGPESESLKNQF